jgi:hypothetical protein
VLGGLHEGLVHCEAAHGGHVALALYGEVPKWCHTVTCDAVMGCVSWQDAM